MPDFVVGDVIIPRAHLNRRDWMRWSLEVSGVNPDGSIQAFPEGGGFEYRFSPERIGRYDFIRVPRRMLESPPWYKARFYAEWLEKEYEGWTTGELWNGWATPHFEFDVAMAYASNTREARRQGIPISITRYSRKKDCFVTKTEGYPEEPELACGVFIETLEYVRLKTYPIGAGSWTWSERVEEEPEEPYHSVKDWRPE